MGEVFFRGGGADAFDGHGGFGGEGFDGGEGEEGFVGHDAVGRDALFMSEVFPEGGEEVVEGAVGLAEGDAVDGAGGGCSAHGAVGDVARPAGGGDGGGGLSGHDVVAAAAEGEEGAVASGGGEAACFGEAAEEGCDGVFAEVFEDAVGAEVRHVGDGWALGSTEHLHDFVAAEDGFPCAVAAAAGGPGDAAEGFADGEEGFAFEGGVGGGIGWEADVAPAAGLGVGFAEVVEDPLLAAGVAVGVLGDGFDFGVVACFFFAEVFAVDAEAGGGEVGVADAGAAGCFAGDVVALDGSGMDECGDGGADAHGVFDAEGVGYFVDGGFDGVGVGVAVAAEPGVDVCDGVVAGVGAFEEVFLRAEVGVVEEEFAVGGPAVASGAACFLVVGFDAAGDFVVGDEADVRTVDAHAEGVGGDGDVRLAVDELVLGVFAFGVGESGVVGDGVDAMFFEVAEDGHYFFAGGAVDDACFPFADELVEAEEFFLLGVARSGAEGEVVAGEAADDDGGVAEAEVVEDVFPDLAGGGGGEGDGLGVAELFDDAAEAEVVGAEVVAPLAEAVGFVDGDEADGCFREEAHEGVLREAFGGDVEDSAGLLPEGAQAFAVFFSGEGAVDHGGGDAALFEGIDLVFHEGDEGADDEGEAGPAEGGELVAEGFAAAGGHDGEGVLPGHDCLDDAVLPGA